MRTNGEIKMVTPAQVKYIHVLCRQVNWDEELRREMLYHHYEKNSTSDLTQEEASHFIVMLHNVLSTINPLVSDRQIYLIRKLWEEIDYANGEEGDMYLNKFLKKRYQRNRVEELTKQEAIKLIKQIKQMIKQANQRAGKTTVLKRKTQCVHCGAWIMWVQLKDGRREAFDCNDERNATNFHTCR